MNKEVDSRENFRKEVEWTSVGGKGEWILI